MEHPGEIWQEYDFNGERLGGVEPKEFLEEKTKLLGAVTIMLYRFNDGKLEFLFQHRAKKLRANPDKWDISAGGHINLNEPRLDAALRETKEEIGVDLDVNKLEFSVFYCRRAKLIAGLYFYDWTGMPDSFNFNDQEVEEVKWVAEEDLEAFWPNLKNSLRDDEILKLTMKTKTEEIKMKYGNN